MSDTTNTKVTGIQNVPVSPTAPTDGYVLTYVESNSSWEPQPQRGFKKEYFTSDGYWTCPDGVTNILVIGAGGGGGGGGGFVNGAGGGGGAIQSSTYASVSPGSVYSITIGTGGNGSAGASFGNDGTDTIFGSNLAVFTGASGAAEALTENPGVSVRDTVYPNTSVYAHLPQPGMGGFGGIYGNKLASNGVRNLIGGFSGGAAGLQISTHGGGGGGAAGPQGTGGAGGNGSSGLGISGSNASANTGAGGGGGGGGTGGSAGGNGGSGYLYILY